MILVDGQYRIDMRCWRVLSNDESRAYSLNMPADATPEDVLAEAQRLDDMATAPIPAPIVPTPEEKLDAAIVEYVTIGGALEKTADAVVAKMESAKASAYLDQKAVDVKPEPKPGENPAVHIRRDEKCALCDYFLGPYAWAFADVKQAQQEIDARGVVEICPKCMDIARGG